MALASDCASPRTPKKGPPPSALAGLLQPVPTGSIITRSVKASQVCGLSWSRVAGTSPPASSAMRGARYIRSVIDRRGALARLIEQRERAGRCGIGKLAAGDVDRVLGDRIRG